MRIYKHIDSRVFRVLHGTSHTLISFSHPSSMTLAVVPLSVVHGKAGLLHLK